MQLYVPPTLMINKDFLKQVFANEKSLLKMSELRAVNVPKFDELSVKYVYPKIKEDPKVHKYFSESNRRAVTRTAPTPSTCTTPSTRSTCRA